jgi:hypothetical protein
MSNDEDKKYTEKEAHQKFAVDFFNLAWTIHDKKDRTQEDNDMMIHAAHASRFHWGQIGTPTHFERGEWQISRMYAVLNRTEPALYHAKRCLEICAANNIGDWDIAFAYEAIARAYAIAGNKNETEKHHNLAKAAGEKIKDQGDKDYFFSELNTIPEF